MKLKKRKTGLRQFFLKQWSVLAIAPTVTGLAVAVTLTGGLQVFEWSFLDRFFRFRPAEPVDSRIVIVTIDENDIVAMNQWPFSDRVLAKALTQIKAQQPRVIGLDLYRNLPVEPGHAELLQVFRSTPNLIGIQKRFGDHRVPAAKVLKELNQVALADLTVDADGTVRRGLISARDDQDNPEHAYMGLGLTTALWYLKGEGIHPEAGDPQGSRIKLGRTQITPLAEDSGGYIRADTSGYQVLLNYRGTQNSFETVLFSDVLNGKVRQNLFRDRIVLIGSTAESTNDFFPTPYDNDRQERMLGTGGVFIHANLASQIIHAAIDGRKLIQFVPEPLEWVWIFVWSVIGVVVSASSLQTLWIGRQWPYFRACFSILLTTGILVGSSYFLFVGGWWIPVTGAIGGLMSSAFLYGMLHSQRLQNLAYVDGLTQIANRRLFDQKLARQVHLKGSLSLILCDVDHFKIYNDTYGHDQGDVCLQKVAKALRSAVRRTDLVARYGGEEFAVILPGTDQEAAYKVADRVLQQIREMQLAHKNSSVANYVTISCGLVTVEVTDQRLRDADWSGGYLIVCADKALYRSKQLGRDRVTVFTEEEVT